MPGIGPIVTAGPLAAELGEAAGHAAVAWPRQSPGFVPGGADALQREVAHGAVLIGVHVTPRMSIA